MHKKGMVVWEVIIWAIILLIVAVILIYSFQRLFGRETDTISTEINLLEDKDNDLVPQKFDCCPDKKGPYANKGCPYGEPLPSDCK